VDGDTIRYGNERIRLRGLDAPELSEAGGPEARQRLADLLRSGTISVIPQGQDVYGRTIADVFVDGRNVAEVLRQEGYAKRG
jgi:endonuclease YncB( thermonuclease family)